MSKIRGTLVAALGALLVGNAHAVGWGTATVLITNYYAQANGNVVFTTSGNANPDGCASSRYLDLDATQPNFNQLFASLVAAQTSGQQVTLFYNGCISGAYPDITAIAIGGIW